MEREKQVLIAGLGLLGCYPCYWIDNGIGTDSTGAVDPQGSFLAIDSDQLFG